MASLPQQTPSPVAGDDRNLVVVDENYLAPSFEDRVRIFWERHGRTVITALVLIVIFFAAKALFGVYAAHRENVVRTAYSEAGDDIGALRSFTAAHPTAALAGLAWTRIADDAYKGGDYIAAAAAYSTAVPLLKADPIGARARMGQAISLLQAKDASAGSVLEGLANDTTFHAPLRAEAAYHLGVMANEAGRNEDASRWFALAISVDTSGLWAQRASRLIERLPVVAATVATPAEDVQATAAEAVPAVNFPGTTK